VINLEEKMRQAFSLIGARSNLRAKLLLELAKNPGKEYTEAELAKALNTTSAAVSKSLRPIAEGVLKDVLKTYSIFNNRVRVYKIEDSPFTREIVKNIANKMEEAIKSIEKMDDALNELTNIQNSVALLEEKLKSGKISQAEFNRELAKLERLAKRV
jgi:predicted transcriptional regulator